MEKSEIQIDRISFQLGMINCFVEMVACGVKKLAISPPVSPDDYKIVGNASEKIVRGFGIKSYIEKSLLITDLQPAEFTKGKWKNSGAMFRSSYLGTLARLGMLRRERRWKNWGKFLFKQKGERTVTKLWAKAWKRAAKRRRRHNKRLQSALYYAKINYRDAWHWARAWKRAAKKWRRRCLWLERDNDHQRAIASQVPYLKERIDKLERQIPARTFDIEDQ